MTYGTRMRAFVKNTFLEFVETGDTSTSASPMASPRSVISEPIAMVASSRWPTSPRSTAAESINACEGDQDNVVLTSTLLEKLDMVVAEQSNRLDCPSPEEISEKFNDSDEELLEGRLIATEGMVARLEATSNKIGFPQVCECFPVNRSLHCIYQRPVEKAGSDGSACPAPECQFGALRAPDVFLSGESAFVEPTAHSEDGACTVQKTALVEELEALAGQLRRRLVNLGSTSASEGCSSSGERLSEGTVAMPKPTVRRTARHTAYRGAHQEARCTATASTTPGPRLAPQGDAGARPGEGPTTDDASRTTLMLQNLPNDYSRAQILQWLDASGLAGRYNFFYYPRDFTKKAGLGYAFVNMLSSADAEHARIALEGFQQWSVPSNKICSVGWSYPCQGFHANVERFRNSPIMHRSMEDEFKPMTFERGVRIPFPRPTRKVRKPGYHVKRAQSSAPGESV